jgi:hypothetical protein
MNNEETWMDDEDETLKSASAHYLLGTLDDMKKAKGQTSHEIYISCAFRPISDEPEFIMRHEESFLNGNIGKAYYRTTHKYLMEAIHGFIPEGELEERNVNEEMDRIEDYFQDKMILFRPVFRLPTQGSFYYKEIDVTYTPIQFLTLPKKDASFFVVPCLNDKDYEDFKKGKTITLRNWNINVFGLPTYLFYQGKIILSPLEGDTYDCKAKDISKIEEFEIDAKELKNRKLLFEPKETNYIFLEKSTLLTFKKIQKEISIEDESNNVNSSEESVAVEVITETTTQKNEEPASKILNDFYRFTKQKNLFYYLDDIYNFHACLKTRLLTILAGMPGTGKTRLPLEYAHFFGMNEKDNTLLFIPVSPSFSEPNDILGYYNPMSKSYIPSETGLTSFLVHAMKHKDQMHMVIFDEMNLSQIEYYFAPFLSVLERDASERNIRLYDESLECINNQKFPSSINIGSNVLFVGTINIDETTKELSDRLLDRSFVISLKRTTFTKYNGELLTTTDQVIPSLKNDKNGLISILPMRNLNEFNYISSFDADLRNFLDSFNKLDSSIIASFRTSKNIALYLDNNLIDDSQQTDSLYNGFSKSKAIDYVIRQTIIRKIKGPEEDLIPFLGETDSDVTKSPLYELLARNSNLSNFESCKQELVEKAKEMKRHGYVR